MAKRYVKKPVVVEAIQFNGYDDFCQISDWMKSVVGEKNFYEETKLCWYALPFNPEDPDEHLKVRTLEGVMRAEVGDWIIRGVENEFYPCKPDIFEKTYDEDIS